MPRVIVVEGKVAEKREIMSFYWESNFSYPCILSPTLLHERYCSQHKN